MTEEKYIDKINKLLAKAASSSHEAEREECLRLADKLMLNHAIDRSKVGEDPSSKNRPKVGREIWEDLDLPWEIGEELRYLLHAVIKHCGCRAVSGHRKAEVVGFPEDIEYAKRLWPIVMMEMVRHLYPRWREGATFDGNVYAFVKGGYKWQMICDAANEAGVEVKWPDGGRLKRAYHRECKARGEEPTAHTQRHSAFRKSYAQAYQNTISRRLFEMRRRNMQTDDSNKFALALVDTKEQVDREFHRLYPQYDPEVMAKRSAEAAEAERLRREAMTQAERDAEDAKAAREYERYRRMYERIRNKDYEPNGWRHGTNVGENVDLSGGSGHITPNRREVES